MKASMPMLFDKLSKKTKIKNSHNWRKIIIRDIEFLLNNSSRSGSLNLKNHQYCENSVLNYGLPSLSQKIPINIDHINLAKHIQNIISSFEPRLDPKTIRVVPVLNERSSYTLAILFDIYGYCSLLKDKELINLRIALDYSCGLVRIFD